MPGPLGRHVPVVDKGEHEQPLLNEPLPLGVLALQVTVVVIGDDDAIPLVGHLHDVAVVVADHALAIHLARRGVHEHRLALQLLQHMLLWGPQGRGDGMRRLSQNKSLPPKIILRSRSTFDNSGVPSEPTPASPALWPSTSEDRGGLEQNKAAAQVKGLLASVCLSHEESRVWYPTEESHFRHKRPLREKDIHITTGIPAMPSELLGSWHPPQRLLPGPLAESHCADTGLLGHLQDGASRK